jgi:hypothetical protein
MNRKTKSKIKTFGLPVAYFAAGNATMFLGLWWTYQGYYLMSKQNMAALMQVLAACLSGQ